MVCFFGKDLRILLTKVFGTLLSITNKHLVNFIEEFFNNFDSLFISPDPIKIGYLWSLVLICSLIVLIYF